MKKIIEKSILFGTVFAIIMSFAGFDKNSQVLKSEILRLHIRANSDSEFDQQLKLKVRDAILNETSDVFVNCSDYDSAILKAQENIEYIKDIANKTVMKNGYSYSCKAEVKEEYFNTREYDSFTLPAGRYKSILVEIGSGKGHNWWCVVFPTACISAANEKELNKIPQKDSRDIALNPEKYVIKFKFAELYESLKNKLKK